MSTAAITAKTLFISGIPSTLQDCYTLFYRHGMNAQCSKGFYCHGGPKVARERAQKHCQIMNYRFVFVSPMVCDFEKEENDRLNPVVQALIRDKEA